jgi:general nucleoside transport system ATP-binding protein
MQVEVRDLTKTFGALRANDAISLRFGAGQIHGVLGENGAGKSTLMKLLSGYLRADSGSILLDGEPVLLRSPADALGAGVGMIHQDPLDVPAFTALENFFLGSLPATMPDMATARKLLTTIAGQFGFAVPPDAPLARLTVGQRQQLELMRLLAWGARVLILDEPTTGITAAQATALFEAVRRLADSGATVLFVSHKLDEVAALCHTVSVLRAGQVVGEQMAMPQPQGRLLQLMFGAGASQEEEKNRRSASQEQEKRRTGEEEKAPLSCSPLIPFSSSGSPVWRLRGIIAREDNLELHVPALDIPRGALIGLAGLEGSGQRVLLRLLSGRLKPLAGRVLVGDADLTGQRGEVFRRSGVEHLPADRLDDGVVGAFSLAEHFALQAPYLPGAAGEKHGGLLLDRQAARSAAEQAIAAYAIRGTPDTPLVSLSGGNQQRAMLALLPERIAGLLLEQPTRGLDVASARSVWGKLLERRAAGTALMFASADLDELLEYAEHVLVFFAGRVSPLIPRAELSYARLAEMIGGVGFETMNAEG